MLPFSIKSKPVMQTADAQAHEPSALPQQHMKDVPTGTANEVTVNEQSDNSAIAGAQLHAVGSIADISANWSAKVVVASNEQVEKTIVERCTPPCPLRFWSNRQLVCCRQTSPRWQECMTLWQQHS